MKTSTYNETEPLWTLGETIDFDSPFESRLNISLLPIDFFDHWDRCASIADFFGDYFRQNFRAKDSKQVITDVLGETLENAIRYSFNKSIPVEVELRRRSGNLLIQIEHSMSHAQIGRFEELCRELFSTDLDALYLQKMISGEDHARISGIGLILLRKDYDVQLQIDASQSAEGHARLRMRLLLKLDAEASHTTQESDLL